MIASLDRARLVRGLAAWPQPRRAGHPQHVDDSFLLSADDSIASVTDDFHAACAESRNAAAGYGLDDMVLHNRRGPLTLRWVYAHMIEEHARHAGSGPGLARP